jgi:hypothetical protein
VFLIGLSLPFWVDITEEFYWSDNNRYLFAQTSDVSDANRHPNAFYMGIVGNEQRWRFVLKGPDVKNATTINFPRASSLIGPKLISIRWDNHTRILEFDIDGGNALAEERKLDPDYWPRPALNDQIHIGGWFDTWDGGLSLLKFFRIRIYDVRLSDKELNHLYEQERAYVTSRFTPS